MKKINTNQYIVDTADEMKTLISDYGGWYEEEAINNLPYPIFVIPESNLIHYFTNQDLSDIKRQLKDERREEH